MNYYRLFSTVMTVFSITLFVIVFISIISSMARMNKATKSTFRTAKKVMEQTGTDFTHQQHYDYSQAYANKNSAKADSGIKDKPLSEAEKNVLYGK